MADRESPTRRMTDAGLIAELRRKPFDRATREGGIDCENAPMLIYQWYVTLQIFDWVYQAMKRDLDKWRAPVVEFENVHDFCTGSLHENALHAIAYGRSHIDILAEIRPGRPLVIFFNGAATNRDSVSLPMFAGRGVLEGCDASKVFINDPALYLSDTLKIGWYAGFKDASLQDDLTRIIESIIRKSEATRTLLTGGSGGGFAALYYSSRINGSLAVSWNPQTSIFRYHKRFVNEYLKTAWGLNAIPTDESKSPQGLEAGVYKRYSTPVDNYVIYLQNMTDDHVQTHLAPLASTVGGYGGEAGFINDRFYLSLDTYGDGHAAPSKEYLNRLYKELLNNKASWRELFGSSKLPGFLRA